MKTFAAPILAATIVLAPAEFTTANQTTDWSWVEPESDLWLYAHLAAGEAQFCPDDEQINVLSVAANRVKSDDFPDTLIEVIYQDNPTQYACTVDGNFYREPTQSNWENAQYIVENGSQLPENVVWQSDCVQGDGEYMRTEWHVYSYSN